MSQPTESIQDNGRLLHYLLGLLPEDETERLDEASITNEDIAARLSLVEDDLVDAYVTGTLDEDNRGPFEAFYLQSPRRREKVKFAKRFLAAVDRAAVANRPAVAAAAACAGSTRLRHFAPVPAARKPITLRSRVSWPLVTAAASLILACGVWVRDLQWRQFLNESQRQDALQPRQAETLLQPHAEAGHEDAHIAGALERALGSPSTTVKPPASAPPAAISPSASVRQKAAVLFPQTRSIARIASIVVPSAAENVAFDLRLESNEFPQYRALLKDPGTNQVVWRSTPLSARSGTPAFVSVTVPASVFESKHYSIELAGIDRASHETTTGSYAVEIDRQ